MTTDSRNARIAPVLVAALTLAGTACASRGPVGVENLTPGAEIRATDGARGVITGRITRQVNGSLEVAARADGAPARVVLRELEKLELRDGRDRPRGALLGLTAGFGAGVIGGMICMRACPRTERGDRIYASITGGLAGASAGLIIGAMMAPVRWTPVILR